MGVFMGNTQSKHMVRSRSLLLLLAALASTLVAAEIADWKRGLDAIVTKLQTNDDASADVDTIVPENRDPFEVADESPSKLAASEVTTMLQQGKDADACEKLADDLCKTVTDNVQTSNNQIARLQDGSKCQNEGQYEVKKFRQEVNKWETKLKTRTSRATKLANARVKWTYTLNTLTQGQCDQFFQDPAYVKAKQASQNAADLVTKAQSQVTTLTKQWKEHIVRAAVKRTKCECDVRAEYNSAYRAATKNAKQNEKAYAKCKHMKCFLKTRNSKKCMDITVDVPTVSRKKTFAQGVPEKECKGTSSTSSTLSTSSTSTTTTLGSETESGSGEEEVSLPSLQPSPSPMVAANCEDDPGQACLAISTDGYFNGNGNANGHLNPLLYHYPLYNSVEGVPKGCKSSGLTACGKRLDGKTNRCYAEITAGSCGIYLHNSGGFSVEEEGDYARKWTNLVGPPANLAPQSYGDFGWGGTSAK